MRRRTILRAAVLSSLIAIPAFAEAGATGAPGAAPAKEAVAAVDSARDLFRLGSALARQGRWLDALDAFEQSSALRAHPVTTYDIGYCQRALGRYVRAWLSFSAAIAPPAGDAERLDPALEAPARAYREEMERHLARLEVRLGRPDVAIRVDGKSLERLPPGDGTRLVTIVGRDDAAVPEALPAVFELLLDPGSHVFVVSATGSPDTVRARTFSPGTVEVLELGAREDTPATGGSVRPGSANATSPAANAGTAGANTGSSSADVAGPRGAGRVPALVAFAVGAAGFSVGAVFAGLSLAAKAEVDPHCPDRRCPPEWMDREEAMQRNADIATAGALVGLAGAATGAYLWFSAGTRSPQPAAPPRAGNPAPRGARLTPWIGWGTAGVSGRF